MMEVVLQLIAFYRNEAGQVAVELPRLCRKIARAVVDNDGARIDPHTLAMVACGRTFQPTRKLTNKTARRQLKNPDTPMLQALYELARDVEDVWVYPDLDQEDE